MSDLVGSLMEELNCNVVFTIPLFGGIPILESVVVTWICLLYTSFTSIRGKLAIIRRMATDSFIPRLRLTRSTLNCK